MNHTNYKSYTRSMRFRSCAELITDGGELLWGISSNNKAIVLHDSYGRAYVGLRAESGLIDINRFHPSYKGKILHYTHLYIDNVRYKDIVHEQNCNSAWGVYGMANDKHHIVADCFGRVYTGIRIKKGEAVDPKLIIPSYNGKILIPFPAFDIKAGES